MRDFLNLNLLRKSRFSFIEYFYGSIVSFFTIGIIICYMIKRLTILYLFLSCLLFSIEAQNMVLNPCFESVKQMPYGRKRIIECAMGWRSPTFAGSDYYHINSDNQAGIPRNEFGGQLPHSGNAYGGICIQKEYVEYLATTLTEPLVAEQDYLVEFYISRAEKSKSSVNEFGALFSDRIKLSMDMNGIAQKPSVDFVEKKGFKDKKNWIKLSGIYHAGGFETVIILGYFNYNSPKGHKRFCHYYIDDVSVTPIAKDENLTREAPNREEKKDPVIPVLSPDYGVAFSLKNILFETNKTELLPESYPELDRLAEYLNTEISTVLKISGHTDNTGDAGQNKRLSEARAKSVADYLISKGIDELRITYVGYGSTNPISNNSTEEGKLKNRRVEFIISKK